MLTAIISYDIFPYFTIQRGEVTDNGSFKTSYGTFKRESIIGLFSESTFDTLENERTEMIKAHDAKIKQVKEEVFNNSTFKFLLDEGKIKLRTI